MIFVMNQDNQPIVPVTSTDALSANEKKTLLLRTAMAVAVIFGIGILALHLGDRGMIDDDIFFPAILAYIGLTVILFPIMIAKRLPEAKAAFIGAAAPFMTYAVHIYSFIQMNTCSGKFCGMLGFLVSAVVTAYAPIFALVYCIASKTRTGNGRWPIFWKVLLVDAIIIGIAYAGELFF